MKNNTLMYIAVAGAALLLLSKKNNTEVAGIGVSDKLRDIYWTISPALREKALFGEDFFTLTSDDRHELVEAMDRYNYQGRNSRGKSPARHCWDMLRDNASNFEERYE